jgi:hypothetical protein
MITIKETDISITNRANSSITSKINMRRVDAIPITENNIMANNKCLYFFFRGGH